MMDENKKFSEKDLDSLHKLEILLAKLNEMPEKEKEDYLLNLKKDIGTLDIDLSELEWCFIIGYVFRR